MQTDLGKRKVGKMARRVGRFIVNEKLTKAVGKQDWVIYNKTIPDVFSPNSGKTTELLYAYNTKSLQNIRLGWWLYDGMDIDCFTDDVRYQIDALKRENECDEEEALQAY